MSEASEAVERQLGTFLRALLGNALERAQLDRAVTLNARLSLLASLRETIDGFAENGGQAGDAQPALIHALAQSLHMLLCELDDAASSGDPAEVALLLELTADPSEMMHAIRMRIAATNTSVDPAPYEAMFRATGTFERAVWLIRQTNLQLVRSGDDEPALQAP